MCVSRLLSNLIRCMCGLGWGCNKNELYIVQLKRVGSCMVGY